MVKNLFFLLIFVFLFSCQGVIKSQMVMQENFGSNPGNLNFYQYVPSGMTNEDAPLILVLHGCNQTAADYAKETEWHKLAERFKFYLIFPEEKKENQIQGCFRFSEKKHRQRDMGEVLSIKQMIDYAKSRLPIDSKRVYITGVSAGGSMAMNMISAYPEIFAAAGVNAAVPYFCDKDVISVFSFCLPGNVHRTQAEWLERVKTGHPGYNGSYPKLMAIQGDGDQFVDPSNLDEITKQWTAVHQISENPTKTDIFREHTHKIFTKNNQPDGEILVETYLIHYMDHGTSIDPGKDEDQGGSIIKYDIDGIFVSFAYDRDFYSPYYIAKFFGLVKKPS